MAGFDPFDPHLDLLQNHFIEASAGTGKTFTIENLVARLIVEKGMKLDQILVVTFTRAATLELKTRIRRTLEKQGLSAFEEEKIFTIHSFCFNSLREYAFDSGFCLDQIEESSSLDLLKQAAKDYLRSDISSLHPKQLELVLKMHQSSVEKLVHHLVAVAKQRVPIERGPSFQESDLAMQNLLKEVDPELLFEDLITLAPYYEAMRDRQKNVKHHYIEGFRALTQGDWIESPLRLMSSENRLTKKEDPPLHYPNFLQRALAIILPALDELLLFSTLAEGVRQKIERLVEEKELLFFEDLISLMGKNVDNPHFASKVRSQYRAVLIDEFQDTDQQQWKIFSTLFLNHLPLYLVGDPKQAIYRFRRADLYTYLKAREEVGNVAVLERNFRSTPALIDGLNQLFTSIHFSLPMTGEQLSYHPVQCGEEKQSLLPPILTMRAKDEQELFELVIQEIREYGNLCQTAVLVKDRFQAERFQRACSLPTRLYKARSLVHSIALKSLQDLLTAALDPYDRNAVQLVLGGPFSALKEEDFYDYHQLLEKRGLLLFFKEVIAKTGSTVIRLPKGEEIYQDALQLVEMMVEQQLPKENYLLFLQQLKEEEPDNEQLRARQVSEEGAIPIMTIHASKGLEFDLVFPIGLALPIVQKRELVYSTQLNCYSLSEEEAELHRKEIEAELLRLTYVAFTRAKKRLYIPIIEDKAGITQRFSQENFPEVERRAATSFQSVAPVTLQPAAPLSIPEISCKIQSFSSLTTHVAEKKEVIGEFPAGAEVGRILHTLFERLPFEKAFQMNDLTSLIRPMLRGSCLEPFLEPVAQRIKSALHLPLPAKRPFSLAQVDPKKMIKEMEFLYPTQEGYMKGFIDLFFEYEEVYYLVDWKSNLIEDSIDKEVERENYRLQAKIYREAIERYSALFANKPFGNAFYIFLREDAAISLD